MEDQGKRLLVAVALCALIIFVTTWIWGPKPPAEQAQGQGPAPAATTTPDGAQGTAPAGDAPGAAATQPSAATVASEPETPRCDPNDVVTVRMAQYEATFSSCGGALAHFRLAGTQYQRAGQPIDLVRTSDKPEWYAFQTGLVDPTANPPYALDPQAKWTVTQKSENVVEATGTVGGVTLVKTYTLRPDKYAIDVNVRVAGVAATTERRFVVDLYGYQDPSAKSGGTFTYAEPHWNAACYVSGDLKHHSAKGLAGSQQTHGDEVKWVGFDHKYFLFAAAPKAREGEKRTCVLRGVPGERAGVMASSLVYEATKVEPGVEWNLTIFAGPKLLDQLETVATAGGGDTKLHESVDLGWFAFIARPMLWLLKVFHGWVNNWGVAIILLTITVKLLTLYWTTKSMRSMKAMAKLKPKMDEIREKYANDKQRMNLEMMNLYKAHQINPLGGCLPMLLQMPVWFALYATLQAAAELYQAPFVGWIRDLTAPDPYYVVPVLMTGLMFLQQKMTPTAVDSAQQKMLMIVMPLMFGAFSLFFPAGLTIYILTNTVLSMLHQIYMNKTDDSKLLAEAAKPVSSGSGPGAGAGAGAGKRTGKRPAKA